MRDTTSNTINGDNIGAVSDDRQAVDELIADVRGGLTRGISDADRLLAGGRLPPLIDDGEEDPPVTEPDQVARLWRLKHVLGTALADLP